MADLVPLFSTGPRIQLKLNDTLIAYAVGFNIRVSVDVQPVSVLGKFAPISLEPVMYNTVTGTMQILKLDPALDGNDVTAQLNARDAADKSKMFGSAPQRSVKSPFGQETTEPAAETDDQKTSNTVISEAGLAAHLDPRTVLISRTFNMNIDLRVPANTVSLQGDTQTDAQKQQALLADSDQVVDLIDVKNWMTIFNCRITSRNVNIAQGQLTNEPVNFQGLFMTTYTTGANPIMKADSGVTPS